jgi:hypothetical protein
MAGSRSEQPQSPLLGMGMPRDVRTALIYPFTAIDMLGLFASTCQQAEAETAFPRLLHCAAFALPESYQQKDKSKLAAIAILKRHPELLFQKGWTRDPAGHLIYGSPYQIFLGAGDIWALKAIHEEIIPKMKDGAATTAREQYIEQFPNPSCLLTSFTAEDIIVLKSLATEMQEDLQLKIQSISDEADEHRSVLFDKNEFAVIHQLLSENKREDLCAKLCEADMLYDDRNKAQIAQVTELLKEIVAAISVDPCTNGKATQERTVNAIRALREYLAPQKEKICTGLYSPPEIMKIIHDVYNQNFDPWTGDQLRLYSFEVIGGAQCSASAVDAQCYQKGLFKFDINSAPDRTVSYFTRSGVPGGLGSSFFIDVYWGGRLPARGCAVLRAARGREVCRVVGNLMSNKNTELAKLMRQSESRREAKTSRCVIL